MFLFDISLCSGLYAIFVCRKPHSKDYPRKLFSCASHHCVPPADKSCKNR